MMEMTRLINESIYTHKSNYITQKLRITEELKSKLAELKLYNFYKKSQEKIFITLGQANIF